MRRPSAAPFSASHFLSRAAWLALALVALWLLPLWPLTHAALATWLCTLALAVAATETALSSYAHFALAFATRTETTVPAATHAPPVWEPRSAEPVTALVVPALLNDAATVDELLARLETLYRANRDGRLYFGLLTDFGDAATFIEQGIL